MIFMCVGSAEIIENSSSGTKYFAKVKLNLINPWKYIVYYDEQGHLSPDAAFIYNLEQAGLFKNPGFSPKTQPGGLNWFKPGLTGFYGLNWVKLKTPLQLPEFWLCGVSIRSNRLEYKWV